MAAWLPVLKASLPYVTQVITAAIPAFTLKTGKARPDEIVPKQISELQSSVTQNAESLKALATQIKKTIEGIDGAASKLQRELKLLRRLAVIALVLAVVSIATTAWALLGNWAK